MHICLATQEFPPLTSGGIATYYATLARQLAGAGHRVTVLTVERQTGDEPWCCPGVEVIRLGRAVAARMEQLGLIFPPELGGAVDSIAVGLAMRDWLRGNAGRLGIDVVDAPEYLGSAAFLLDEDLPAVTLTCHGSFAQVRRRQGEWQPTPADAFIAALEQMALGSADELACYSLLNRAEWESLLGRTPRFVTAPLDLAEDGPDRPEISDRSAPTAANAGNTWEQPAPGVCTGVVVGRLQNWKGAEDLLAALRLTTARQTAVRVHWVGRDTPTAPDGSSLAAYLAQQFPELWGGAFTWQDAVPPAAARRLQTEADFAVVPSRWDTFNFTAVEAMRAGVPLIISTGAGASYLATDGENALVVPPGDAQALAAALERLVCEPELRRRLGQAGRQTVLQAFDPAVVVAEHVAAYEAAMTRRRTRRTYGYLLSLLNPFVLQWARTAQLTSDEAVLARTGGRRLAQASLRKLARRIKK